jgi:N-acetylglucosaminyl-diphospho-decaprenol L-rhamnosyltransferase
MEETTPPEVEVSISIVSHNQIDLVVPLIQDLMTVCGGTRFELILTLNIPEELPFSENSYLAPIKIVRNRAPQGFGENHNQAFGLAKGNFFCVLNPDVRINQDPFPALVACLKEASIGVVSPHVRGEDGTTENSFRKFPTFKRIVDRLLFQKMGQITLTGDHVIYPDWIAGMFMLFPRQIFKQVHGFDERYFLYYEDVDICGRLRLLDYVVAVCPEAEVTHYAQRTSHRNARYLRWHLKSMCRFLSSPIYRQLRRRSLL